MTDQSQAITPGRTIIILADCLQTTGPDPFKAGSEGNFLLRLAGLFSSSSGGRILVCSVASVPHGESVSAYSMAARERRQDLEKHALEALRQAQADRRKAPANGSSDQDEPTHEEHEVTPVVRVAPEQDIAGEVRRLLEGEQGALLLLPLRPIDRERTPWLSRAIRKPLPCDIAWARPRLRPSEDRAAGSGHDPLHPGISVLIPARGGPQASLALELSQDLMKSLRAEVTLLHVLQNMPERARATEEAPFTELVRTMPRTGNGSGVITSRRTVEMRRNPAEAILTSAEKYDLLIMGAGGESATDLGRFTERVARDTPAALIAIKTRVPVGPAIRAARKRARPHVLDPETLSIIVDKWFAENTFHADEFADLSRLVDLKKRRGTTISLGLPALNEEETIGEVISVLRERLMQDVPLLDEIVVIDSDSTDRTREIAQEMGVPVYIHQQILPEAGEPYAGKGEALWKSLHVLKGDIIAWVDTDVSNMDPAYDYGLVGPLLREPRIGYVKGYYHRPIKAGGELQHEGGGRVTELTVRPLVNLFFPLLSGLVQPLAGEYAGRREVLEKLPFFTGYGVETGLLIDLLENYGLSSIGQVNLERRVHRNRSLADLSLTAFAIVQVIFTRLQERARIKLLEELNSSMKLIRFEEDHLSLVVRRVRDIERPPIASIPAYREVHPEK